MDPLEAILRQRQQRYEVWDSLTDRLAKIGEDRRRKRFTQAAMSAIPDDAPVTYDVYTNLINEFPSVDPQEAFQIVGGLAKMKTADRTKRLISTLHQLKDLEPGERKKKTDELYPANSDIWDNAAKIISEMNQRGITYEDPNKRVMQTDMFGGRTEVEPAREPDKKEKLLNEWETFKAAHQDWTADKQIAEFTKIKQRDTESDRNYDIYAERLRRQGKTPAPKDIWKSKATNPMENYEAFAEEDYAPKPKEAPKSGGVLDRIKAALGGGETSEVDPLREQAVAELKKRGKAVNEATIRKTILYLKGAR